MWSVSVAIAVLAVCAARGNEDEKMQVLTVLLGSLLLYRVLGAAGVSLFASWMESARFALATMFFFTAVSHFAPMRKDLIELLRHFRSFWIESNRNPAVYASS